MYRLSAQTTRAALLAALVCCCPALHAQRHSLGSAPPTAPTLTPSPAPTPKAAPVIRQPAPAVRATPTLPVTHAAPALLPPSGPIAAISTGLGAIQFASASLGVPAPQTIIRQLSADDERTRIGALTSLGAPGQYLIHGHVPVAHSMQLDMLQLSNSDDLDAVLTVELDQHVVSAILIPDSSSTWRRVATLSFASSFSSGTTTPSNFIRPQRSLLQPGRYRAVYHATVNGPNGDFTENEANVRVLNGRADVVMSFVSGARQCDTTGQVRPAQRPCEILQRWLEPDPTDPTHRFTLITGMGHFSAHEASDPLSVSRSYRLTRLRQFACQPFVFSDAAQHFEPLANSAPCATRDAQAPRADHPTTPPAERP